MNVINKNIGVLLLVLYILILTAYGINTSGPAYLSDEVGYLTKAAFFAGKQIDYPSAWYAGYSLLISPAFLISDPEGFAWRIVNLINNLMFAIAALTLYKLNQLCFYDIKIKENITATIIASTYPSFIVLSGYSFATPAVLMFNVAIAYFIAKYTKNNCLRSLGLAVLFVTLLSWTHPTGVVALGGLIAVLTIKSFIDKKYLYNLLAISASVGSVILYKLILNPEIQKLITLEGNNIENHYETSIIDKLLGFDFWYSFPLFAFGQFTSVVISSFGLILIGVIYIGKNITNLNLSIGLAYEKINFLFLYSIICLLLVIAIGAFSFSLSYNYLTTSSRVDLWIYTRYADPFIYFFISAGVIAVSKWDKAIYGERTLLIFAGLVLAFFALNTSELNGYVNGVNIISFWPHYLFPDKGLLFWLILGGFIIYLVYKFYTKFILYFVLIVYVISIYGGWSWHQAILLDYSRKDSLVNFLINNHEPKQCIGWDKDSIVGEKDMRERRNILSYYLVNFKFARMTFEDWLQNCDGVFLTHANDMPLNDSADYVAIGNLSGVNIIANRNKSSYFDYTGLNKAEYYHANGSNLNKCLQLKCYFFDSKSLSKFTEVGVYSNDSLETVGRAGYLNFGPYINLKSGKYNFTYGYRASNDTNVLIDVVSGFGLEKYHSENVKLLENSEIIQFSVELDKDVDNLEVRLYVDGAATINLKYLEIVP